MAVLLRFVVALLLAAACMVSQGSAQIAISDLLADQTLDSRITVERNVRGEGHVLRFSGNALRKSACLESEFEKQATVGILANSCASKQCYTFSTSLRLLKKNFDGTLFHVKSPAGGELRLHFAKSFQVQLTYYSNQELKTQKFFYGFKRNRWMQLTVVICPNSVTLYLDCYRLFHETISPATCLMPSPLPQVCVGGTVDGSSPILADVRDMTLFGGDQSSQLCPHFAGKDTDVLVQTVSSLQEKVLLMQREMEGLKLDLAMERTSYLKEKSKNSQCRANSDLLYSGLAQAENKIISMAENLTMCTSAVQQFSCTDNGTIYTIGTSFRKGCQSCTCEAAGVLNCRDDPVCSRVTTCPLGSIVRAQKDEGICCDQCVELPGACVFDSALRLNGTTWLDTSSTRNKLCRRTCTCVNSKSICRVLIQCPSTLPCPASQRYQDPEKDCCHRCVPDHCENTTCGAGQKCTNTPNEGVCECRVPLPSGECSSVFDIFLPTP